MIREPSRVLLRRAALAALGRVNARIGLEVANADARPTWNRGDFFGEKFGRAK